MAAITGRTRVFAVALTAAVLVYPSIGSAGDPVPTCHGKPATVVGTPGDDNFGSDSQFSDGDVVVLLGGDDKAVDYSKNVTICGNGGKDKLMVSARDIGENTLIDGGHGADEAGEFNDPDYRGRGPVTMYGGDGNDLLLGTGRLGRGPGGDDKIFAG